MRRGRRVRPRGRQSESPITLTTSASWPGRPAGRGDPGTKTRLPSRGGFDFRRRSSKARPPRSRASSTTRRKCRQSHWSRPATTIAGKATEGGRNRRVDPHWGAHSSRCGTSSRLGGAIIGSHVEWSRRGRGRISRRQLPPLSAHTRSRSLRCWRPSPAAFPAYLRESRSPWTTPPGSCLDPSGAPRAPHDEHAWTSVTSMLVDGVVPVVTVCHPDVCCAATCSSCPSARPPLGSTWDGSVEAELIALQADHFVGSSEHQLGQAHEDPPRSTRRASHGGVGDHTPTRRSASTQPQSLIAGPG